MSNLSFTFPLKIMARPFRWPLQKQDLLLATEVASRQVIKQSEFEPIASVLSVEFGKLTPGKPVSLVQLYGEIIVHLGVKAPNLAWR